MAPRIEDGEADRDRESNDRRHTEELRQRCALERHHPASVASRLLGDGRYRDARENALLETWRRWNLAFISRHRPSQSRFELVGVHQIATSLNPLASKSRRSLPSARCTKTRTLTSGLPITRAVSAKDWSSKYRR